MKICVLTSLFPSPPRPREGIFALRRWERMAARGHAVHVLQPVPHAPRPFANGARSDFRAMPTFEERDGFEVYRPRYVHLPRWPLGNAERFARTGLRGLKHFGTVDVVVCDYAWPAAIAAHGLRESGIPCVVNGRGSDVLQVAGEAGLGEPLGAALRAAGHWTAVSQDLVDAMDRVAGRPGVGVLVPNGVDLDAFTPGSADEARAALGRAERGVRGSGPLVLVVGHLIARKDPLLALESFRLGAPPDARLVFLGRGPLDRDVERAAAEAGLGERVELRGEVRPEELATWYRAADALLLTSHREGRPNVVLEALASGTPVLATQAGGTGELLAELPGALVTSRDPADIGRALAELLASPPSAASLRESVVGLTWEACLDRLEEHLDEVLRTASHP
ncbi:Putative teichuronic acid biosynthesis glycosyltransferase TuaC [Planctomycetes bacterium Pla163]|uniref:Teichuronic acid biosynthesis glycosyltransferase TuaC n=1 Tax=Rohdeia mirabilis TaxID=2528008 RepID=A0A518D0E0_9BACT|nr:Putative teichuronic acid biosynthesis glycosyltransferase TuaC [Planctomycetes bacterium Pla163]